MQWGNHFSQRKYIKPLGIRTINQSCAEQHEMKKDHVRFNQKMNMIFQPNWNEKYKPYTDKLRNVRRDELIRKGIPGYQSLDWGFMQSSSAGMRLTGSGINSPNQGMTSWDIGGGMVEGTERWQGSPERAAEIVKSVCSFYGADMVGICELDRRHVYSHYFDLKDQKDYPIVFSDEAGYEHITAPTVLEDKTQVIPAGMKYAIVMLFEMNDSGIATAPSMLSQATTHSIYSKMGFTIQSVAEFLRGIGYNALPSLNDTAASIPLAVNAGLGEVGRNAKLINPLFGPRCRICKVFTDLPLAVDSPIEFGARRFCETCDICADHCPCDCIPEGERTYEARGEFSQSSVKQWQLDHDKCRMYWAKTGTNCGICLHTCPYNDTKPLRRWLFISAAACRLPKLNKWMAEHIEKHRNYKRMHPDAFWKECDGR